MLQVLEDKFDGIIVDTATLPKSKAEFTQQISELIALHTNKKLLWITIPIEKSEFIPILTKLSFEFHNCDESYIMLVKKINNNAEVPISKNFIVGVGAIVFLDGQLLVVKDKFSIGYKLPGGQINKNETIKNALIREVYEETGISVALESIVNIGHFRNGQFGESNLYIVGTAKALNNTIMVHDVSEIIEAKWIAVDEFLQLEHTNEYNKSVVKAALRNSELKLTEQHIQLRVKDAEVFF